MADRLEKKGLLKREECEEDGRGIYVSLTTQGSLLRLKMWDTHNKLIDSVFGQHLKEDQAALFAKFLQSIICRYQTT